MCVCCTGGQPGVSVASRAGKQVVHAHDVPPKKRSLSAAHLTQSQPRLRDDVTLDDTNLGRPVDKYKEGTDVFEVTQCLAAITSAQLCVSAKTLVKEVRVLFKDVEQDDIYPSRRYGVG